MDSSQGQFRNNERAIYSGIRRNAKNHFRKVSASSRVGCPAVPPARCVDKPPHTHANRSDFSNGQPFRYPYRKPASKLSPAPSVSTTFTGIEATLTFSPQQVPNAP